MGRWNNGNSNNELKIDMKLLQKKIDVKELKTHLWTYIDPKVHSRSSNQN